jgi:tetratricopeptide (TPR) repeat protein
MMRKLTFTAVLGVWLVAGPALAADSETQSGFVRVRSNPCMTAKYGKGETCELPALPETADAAALAAARLKRARHYIDMGEVPNALAEADQALAIAPDNIEIRHLVARLAMSTGDYARAERELKLAIAQRPDDADILATNAVRLKARSWHDEALKAFDRVLVLRPDHRFAREERATLLMSLGRPKDSIADFDMLLADRRDANLLVLRGTARMAARDTPKAIDDFNEALKLSPGRFDILTARAMAFEVSGNDQAALDDYDAILGPVDGQPNIVMRAEQLAGYRAQRARVLVHLNRFADASTEMVNSISAGGRNALLRAQVYLRQNGFPDVPLDGKDSPELRTALKSCFGLNSCFQKVSGPL